MMSRPQMRFSVKKELRCRDAGWGSVSRGAPPGTVVSRILRGREVHAMLDAFLPPATYYRFNPFMNEDISMDENRHEKLNLLQADGVRYLERNEEKLKKVARILTREKGSVQRMADWARLRADICGVLEHQQRVYLENNVPDRFSAPRPPHIGSGAAARASGVRTPPERRCSCMLLRAPASVCMRARASVNRWERRGPAIEAERRDKCTRGLGAERDRA
ncbi:Calcium-independent phospholipase A2-gamma [Liparis tanakae]|uniref:Calcium-independent phospholipase A2-gamma n=1 Tax=Liparis tanakae TaxID=230148 RepID=A0A4Z2I0Q2_9TELE|nr:Calcium-independent phospholipase A2-gamma [Liparis tanakae]